MVHSAISGVFKSKLGIPYKKYFLKRSTLHGRSTPKYRFSLFWRMILIDNFPNYFTICLTCVLFFGQGRFLKNFRYDLCLLLIFTEHGPTGGNRR